MFGGGFGGFGNTGGNMMSKFSNNTEPQFLLTKTAIEELLEQVKAKFPQFYDQTLDVPATQGSIGTFGKGMGASFNTQPAGGAKTAFGTFGTQNTANQPGQGQNVAKDFKMDFKKLLQTSNDVQNICSTQQHLIEAKIHSANLKSVPDLFKLTEVVNNWTLENEHGRLVFEEAVDIGALLSHTQSLNLDNVIQILPGQIVINRHIYNELNKQVKVTLFNVEDDDQLRSVIEAQGWLFCNYSTESGELIFRIPRE